MFLIIAEPGHEPLVGSFASGFKPAPKPTIETLAKRDPNGTVAHLLARIDYLLDHDDFDGALRTEAQLYRLFPWFAKKN